MRNLQVFQDDESRSSIKEFSLYKKTGVNMFIVFKAEKYSPNQVVHEV